MLCDKCGKNHATTHIKTIVNGVIKEYNLCPFCAAKEGYSTNSLAGMLSSMFSEISSTDLLKYQTKCSVCGSTFSDIAKTGKAGCSECYTTFYNELLPYLKRLHGSTNHIGKVPGSIGTAEKDETIEQLKNELIKLVSDEKYEQAAVIRDKIKEIEARVSE